MRALEELPGVIVGDNEPYSGKHPSDFTVDHHAEAEGLPHVSIELRQDLIGSGPLALIPEHPPEEARAARRKEATYVHAQDAGVSKTVGYRPRRRGRPPR